MKPMDPDWVKEGQENNWQMPEAPWWARLPIVRHVRATVIRRKVLLHGVEAAKRGAVPSTYGIWVVFGIWHGQERPM